MLNKKQLRRVKNEQRVLQFLKKQKTPLTMTNNELARRVKIYDQKFKLVNPTSQGILDILKRLEPEFIMRDVSKYKQRIIINQPIINK